MTEIPEALARVDAGQVLVIAGPTASGKSALALSIARRQGRAIVNADALQVHATWRVLTARPSPEDEAAAPHLLYGHVHWGGAYSVGRWLREVGPLLDLSPAPVIVGGTGLFLSALSDGLADIPETEAAIRAEADERMGRIGVGAMAAELDASTSERIDRANPARVQRAWEVLRQTGRGLADWHRMTGPPLLPPGRARAFVMEAPKEVLTPRIGRRFDDMLRGGALDEARAILPRWHPAIPAAKAIGAAELVAHLRGEMGLDEARERAVAATRRYAKRQRTWFRSRMADWERLPVPDSDPA